MGKKKKTKKSKKEKKDKNILFEIKLKIAKKKDFLEIDRYEKRNGKQIKVYKQINGMPYWLINSKGDVENKNYILNEETDLKSFSNYLVRKQVLIPKTPFHE
jgi:hypothetical protein